MVLDSDINGSSLSRRESSNKDLDEQLLVAKMRAAFDAKARNFNEMCWDMCIDKAGAKLDQKTATCLSNCVERFIDASNFIGQRLFQSIQSNTAHSHM